MDLTLLSTALQELLTKNKRVVLPGIGTFVIEEVPPTFLNGGKTITPPSQEIIFSAEQMQNDGELETAFARLTEYPQEECRAKMALMIEQIRSSIHINRQASLPGFGTIHLDSNYQFRFTPDKAFCFASDYYLLESISLKSEEGEFQIAPESDLSHVFKLIDENPDNKDVWVIKNGEPLPEEDASPTTVEMLIETSVENEELAPIATESTQNQEIPQAGASNRQQPIAADLESISDTTPLKELASSVAPTAPPPALEVPAATVSKHKSHKWVWIILSILGTLLLACILIYVFKEELTPILEKILYTPEELKILHLGRLIN